MNFVKRFFGHLRTVNRHRAMVRKLCFKCGLYWQGLTHDLSKYSPVEFWNGVKFYTGTKSPHYGEREVYGYSKAWLNHKGRNKHHGEYWQDIRPNGLTEPIPMPTKYFIEMLSHKDENQFHERTHAAIVYWLEIVAAKGSEEAFKRLKRIK